MKFQVGDIVVGNSEASSMYDITRHGSILEVMEYIPHGDADDVILREGYFRGKVLYSARGHHGSDFLVREEYFELKESFIQENE